MIEPVTTKEAQMPRLPVKAKTVRLDEDLERERLEPGLNTAGTGDVGTDPAQSKGRGNSNT